MDSDCFVETEDDEAFGLEDERRLSDLIKAASASGQVLTQQSQVWEMSSVAVTSSMAMTMIQRQKFVRPWEGQGVKVIGGGKLVDYLEGEPIPEAPVDENEEAYNWF